jgi:hypothetical protein
LDTVTDSPSRSYSKTYTNVSFSWEGQYFIRVTSVQGTVDSRTVDIFVTPVSFAVNYTGLNIDFGASEKSEIRNTLMASHKQWGGANGGTVVEAIEIDRVNGLAKIASCGDNYTGSIKGVDRDGNPSGFNTRIGGCLVTKEYFGAGSYRVVAKGLQVKGACNAMWTFHYEEAYPENVSFWNEMASDGLHVSGDIVSGYYYVRNHEIDIEFPTALKDNPDQEDVSFRNCRFNTWQGELRNWDVPETDPAYWSEYTDNFTNTNVDLNDDDYHEYRFDWHLGNNPRVEFYIDGVLKETNTTHVPTIPGRFWVGNWFPSGTTQWAGRPANYNVEYMTVKSIEIIPYIQYNSDLHLVQETYPDDVFREIPLTGLLINSPADIEVLQGDPISIDWQVEDGSYPYDATFSGKATGTATNTTGLFPYTKTISDYIDTGTYSISVTDGVETVTDSVNVRVWGRMPLAGYKVSLTLAIDIAMGFGQSMSVYDFGMQRDKYTAKTELYSSSLIFSSFFDIFL